jgi:uncharacterized membrane protein
VTTPFNDQTAEALNQNGQHAAAVVTVQATAAQLRQALAGLEGLPRFVECLESVTRDGAGAAQWVARSASGERVTWETDLLNEKPNQLIAWRTRPTAPLTHAATIAFRELPFGAGTEVKVIVEFIPQRGAAMETLMKALGRDPSETLRLALCRMRQFVETGEIATTRGQPAGRGGGRDEEGSTDERRLLKECAE